MEVASFAVGACFLLGYAWKRSEETSLWLEEVNSPRALAWVTSHNESVPESGHLYDRILSILDSKEKIAYASCLKKGWFYNFWQDSDHELGIWRRVSEKDYPSDSPNWEVVIDIDELNREEPGNEWRWKGATVLDDDEADREDLVLVKLSKGGGDAVVIREFSLTRKCFLAANENPFNIPEGKTSVSYMSRDCLLVGTDLKTSESLTDSGYPRQPRKWVRGTRLEDSTVVFTGNTQDVSVSSHFSSHQGFCYHTTCQSLTFYTSEYFIHEVSGKFKSPLKMDSPLRVRIPKDAEMDIFADQIIVELRSDWLQFASGSLLATPTANVLANRDFVASDFQILFQPKANTALKSFSKSVSSIVIIYLEDVCSKSVLWRFIGGRFASEGESLTVPGSEFGEIECWAVNSKFSESFWTSTEGYTIPVTLSIVDGLNPSDSRVLKQAPAKYDVTDVVVKQEFAISKDGTKIPFFMIYKNDSQSFPRKTLLYGYGGFEISLTPSYSATFGAAWIEHGYVYVVANIRGGGEYGPKWHQAALRENRNKAYEDFEAVAERLLSDGITSKQLLGCMGGSNGGLLVGNEIVRSPHLFSAVVCQVPLLDMQRYNKLLAGASWMVSIGFFKQCF